MTPQEQIIAAMRPLIQARLDQMIDTCRVTRAGEATTDDDGNVTVGTVTVYEGRCIIADPSTSSRDIRTVQDESGIPNQRVLRVPHEAALRDGDSVTVTAAAVAPGLTGETFTVVGEEEHRSYASYRRYKLRGTSYTAS